VLDAGGDEDELAARAVRRIPNLVDPESGRDQLPDLVGRIRFGNDVTAPSYREI
jgi:hypothetical protein